MEYRIVLDVKQSLQAMEYCICDSELFIITLHLLFSIVHLYFLQFQLNLFVVVLGQYWKIFFSFSFGVWATPSSVQHLLLPLCSGITLGWLRGQYEVLGIEPGSAMYKTSSLPYTIFPAPGNSDLNESVISYWFFSLMCLHVTRLVPVPIIYYWSLVLLFFVYSNITNFSRE